MEEAWIWMGEAWIWMEESWMCGCGRVKVGSAPLWDYGGRQVFYSEDYQRARCSRFLIILRLIKT